MSQQSENSSGNMDASTSTSTLNRTRGTTKMCRVQNSTDLPIEFVPKTYVPTGTNGAKYSNWVGLEVRTKISILEKQWNKIDEYHKDHLWSAIKVQKGNDAHPKKPNASSKEKRPNTSSKGKRTNTSSEGKRPKLIAEKKKAKPMPAELLQNRPTILKYLHKRLASNEEYSKKGVMATIEAGIIGTMDSIIVMDYEDLKDLIIRGCLDQNIIAWFMVNHWVLQLIQPRSRTVIVLDSLRAGKTAETYQIKTLMETVITTYNNVVGSCVVDNSVAVTWKLSMCNQQVGDWECGYYVVNQMLQFVMSYKFEFPTKYPWKTLKPFTLEQPDEIACSVARSIILKLDDAL